MLDLNHLLEEIEFLPDKIYQAAIESATLQNEYETMKEEIKHKRAAIVNCYSEVSQAKAETTAYASLEYKAMLDKLSQVRLNYLKASAYYEYLMKKYDSNKTQQIALMAQMKLV
jgi:regulator of sigma D